MDKLIVFSDTWDRQFPIPLPPEPLPDPPKEDFSDDSAEADAARYDVVVAWIDDKMGLPQNVALVNRVSSTNPRVYMLCFPSLPAFQAWLEQEGFMYISILKLITCGRRPKDGDLKAAENVVNFRDNDSRMKSVPVMVYCGDPAPHQALIKRGVLVTTQGTTFYEYCTKI